MNTTNWKSNIIRFFTAQTISLFGSSIVQYAIIWHITLTTSSGIMITISTLCGFLPQILISLFAGVWIDRYHRKWMIMLADSLIAIATLAMAILFLFGVDSIWLLFVVLLIRSAGTGIQTPAVNSLVPQIVPKENLMKVNGFFSTVTSLIMFLSPAISGAILSISSLETTLIIDVITAVIGVGITFTIPIAHHKIINSAKSNTFKEIKSGLVYLKTNQFIKNLLVFLIVIAILISPSAFLTPLMISRTYGGELWRLTVSEMVFSAGASFGGVFIATRKTFSNRMHTTILAGLFYGILMIIMGISPFFYLYLLANFLIGITMPCFNAPITVLIQEQVEPSMHGRVFSFIQIANSCSLPLGMIIFGPLADFIKVEYLLIGAGIAVVALNLYARLGKAFKKSSN